MIITGSGLDIDFENLQINLQIHVVEIFVQSRVSVWGRGPQSFSAASILSSLNNEAIGQGIAIRIHDRKLDKVYVQLCKTKECQQPHPNSQVFLSNE